MARALKMSLNKTNMAARYDRTIHIKRVVKKKNVSTLWTLGTPATTPSVFIGLSRLKKANATPVARSVASRGL